MRKTGIREARRVARALVYRLGITSSEHIRIEAIAKRLGLKIVVTRLDGADAQLVRTGGVAEIQVSDRITDVGARRFIVGHELGHFVLGHPSTPPHMLSATLRMRKGSEYQRDYEAEANAFASELLMPYILVRKLCEVSPVSLREPWLMARMFSVSILTSTIRLTELSPERCAAIFSANRRVVWVAPSETFTRDIERGRTIDPHSVAWDFFLNGALDDREQPVPADAWFDTSVDVEIIEHSTASVEHGTVLSLLWIPERVAAPLGMAA